METIKNYIIAGLGALLVLSITIQPAQSAGKSKEAKMVEYDQCITIQIAAREYARPFIKEIFADCALYRP